MAVLTKDAYLPHHCLSNVRVFILSLLKLLNCNYTTCFLLLCLEDFTVGALPYHLQNTVLVHLCLPNKIIFILSFN